jgi:hypothetical protein
VVGQFDIRVSTHLRDRSSTASAEALREHDRRAKARKRPKGGVTGAQQEARRKFIAESPVKPSRDGMEAIHRELIGSE